MPAVAERPAAEKEVVHLKMDRHLVADVDLLATILNAYRAEAFEFLLRQALNQYQPVLQKLEEAKRMYDELNETQITRGGH